MRRRFQFRPASLMSTWCCPVAVATLLGLSACGGAPHVRDPIPQADENQTSAQLLNRDDVTAIMNSAVQAVDRDMAVAITDRRGVVLGLGTTAGFTIKNGADYSNQCAACAPTQIAATNPACAECTVINLAVQLARTAAFFSANQTPLTSRSVRFLSGEHFPPGVRNTGAAALFGIENTNRGCSFEAREPQGATFNPGKLVPRARNLASLLSERSGGPPLACQNGVETANGIFSDGDPNAARQGCTTGIATLPGAVPIYKSGIMVGGIGVALPSSGQLAVDPVAGFDSAAVLRRVDTHPDFQVAEFAARAFAGDDTGFPTVRAKGLQAADPNLNILPARRLPFDPVIFVDGVEIPEVNLNPPLVAARLQREVDNFIVDPASLETGADCLNSTRQACYVSSEWLVGPHGSSAGAQPLSAGEVRAIIEAGLVSANKTRAAIRVPLEARTAMVLAISDTQGALIGLYRMPDATVFSIDVAVAKSRNVIYFSDPNIDVRRTQDCPGLGDCRGPAYPPGTAITNRTLSFGAQPFFPSGIDGTSPGPFRSIFIDDSVTPCVNGGLPQEGGQATNGRQNGIVFFPGSAPLYRDGVLVGGFGVSGDGVEQDDIVTIAGTLARSPDTGKSFEPPAGMRADQVKVRGVRLPYVKFNRQPEQ